MEQTFAEYIRDVNIRRSKVKDELVIVCRSIPALLRDLGHKSTADRLEEKLFLIDAIEGEITARFLNNPEGCMNDLLKMLGEPGK